MFKEVETDFKNTCSEDLINQREFKYFNYNSN